MTFSPLRFAIHRLSVDAVVPLILFGLWVSCGSSRSSSAACFIVNEPQPSAAHSDLFQEAIAPLLATRCLQCHSSGQAEAKLDLSSREGFLAGGESGPVFDPDSPLQSSVWLRVHAEEMPPEGPALAAQAQAQLKQWLESGAPWTLERIDPFAYSSPERAGYDWWSLQPIREQAPPEIADDAWSRGPIDRFILQRLSEAGLSPADETSPLTLARRLSFDLTGLPLDQETLERFLRGTRPNEVERLTDRLLASPAYGERWARHWLDVVRFGESQGYERNRIREQAWRYRDWVVAALNQGLPYDEFVRQQIAGDLLHPQDYSATIATGYHVIGTWDQVAFLEGSASMKAVARQDHVEDLVATFGQAFLGMTVQCARCHDHKYDPIAQNDYYRIAASLAGIWQNEKEVERVVLDQPGQVNLFAGVGERYEGAAHLPALRAPEITHVLARGRLDQPLREIEPGVLSAVRLVACPIVPTQDEATLDEPVRELAVDANDRDRRLRLATWVTDLRQPLTARVVVNRLWHYHFTVGIVDTPSDFGFAGGRPSHPELLDWLASQLLRSDWDLKTMHRRMATSATYRQAAKHAAAEEASNIDSDVRLRWRAPLRPLEGEAVRDAMLDAAGMLNRSLGGPSYRDVLVKLSNNHEFTDPDERITADTCRRTLYRLWARSGNLPLLQSLDCPDPSVMAPRRLGTITPLQALSLQNGSLVNRCAQELARRLESECGPNRRAQIKRLWELTLMRPPTQDEVDAAIALCEEAGLSEVCLAVFNCNEFSFLD